MAYGRSNIKKNRRIQEKCMAVIMASVIFLCLFLSPAGDRQVAASEESADKTGRVVRVGVVEAPGLSEIDKYGNHTGLIIDYLNEIAKYTNWEYEYIDVGAEELIGGFLDGEYELMGGTYYSPELEQYFAYPDYSMGGGRVTLLCMKDNDELRSYDLQSLNGKVIGVYEKAGDKIERLKEYLRINGIDCTLKYYTSAEMEKEKNLYDYLENGDVDLLMGNDLDLDDEFRVVTSFEAQPYYIVTQPGNEELLDGLNMAMENILVADPNFAVEKYEDNYPDLKTADIRLDSEELDYIAKKKTVSVAIVKDWHPFYCIDNTADHHKGMIPDFLSEISDYTGLKFEYVFADSYKEALELLKSGKADIMGGFLDSEEEAFADGMALTKSYVSLNSIIIKNKSADYPDSGLVGGILEGRTMPKEIQADKVRTFGTSREGMQAVNNGEIDFYYGLSAHMDQEMQNHRYVNLVPVTRVNNSTQISFAMRRPVDTKLFVILNKAIGNISTKTTNTILDKNLVSMGYTQMPLSDLIYANPFASIVIIVLFCLMILAGIFMIMRSKWKNRMMQAELEKSEVKSQAKGEFLSKMSHEIRTPMNAIVGLADLAEMEKDVPAPVRERLRKIHSSSKYLLSLINDILDMSKIENGKMEIKAVDFLMGDLLDEIEEMVEHKAQENKVAFRQNVDIQHFCLKGDPLRLRQVLLNLLSNAIKFTPENGIVTLTIKEQSSTSEEARYYFSVEDTGIGIAPKFQNIIFSSFEQVGTNMAQNEGTGLGLPISDQIVQTMGGKIQVESVQGEGSNFYFTIDLKLGEEKDIEKNLQAEDIDLNGERILLTEDNDLNAEIAKDLLECKGASIERASNGEEAVRMFLQSSEGYYNVILMDIRMPVKDGLTACREIRASVHPDSKTIPIIAMTANSFKEDEERAMEAGMTAFVPKPIDLACLYGVLRSV